MQVFKKTSKISGLIGLMMIIISCDDKDPSDFYVHSVVNPIINLNGDWKISLNPSNEFWKDTIILDDSWKNVKVPGEVMMQGFLIKSDVPFAYKKEIIIPADYKEKNIYLQFEGVYSYAKVWVNGNYVRDHHGGFTQWKCDITPFVKVGEKAMITVEVTDRADDISYASGYAKHQIGGILRDVNLLALPKNYPDQIQIETDLDLNYEDASLIVSGKLMSSGKNSKVEIQLFDDTDNEVALNESTHLINNKNSFRISNTVITPKKWDAEHPNLYTLKVSFYENDKLLWRKNHPFGFREIAIEGNSLKVNGNSVKLRGACRHDNHPTLGRVSTPDYELKDVLLAKEANMNYIRTSHYPPSDNFLKLCDKYGIYVEDETAVCFVINYRIKGYETASNSQSDSIYTDRYLSQVEEMINTHRNHPSVIIWSIGNESIYGTNFKKSFDWIQENDKTRPVMFSYPGTAPDSIAPYHILSMHYPGIDGDLNQYNKKTKGFGFKEMPVIFDEWAHVACYNNFTIKEDPNIRDFWGQSLDKMWAKTYDADGGLGGAIWGMIDETFMLPENLKGFRETWGINDNTVLPYQGTTVGYGEWGIVDIWRRKKPEFWNTKKAYTPIKILKTFVEDFKQGSEINIPIYNRFDHTNLNEILVKYTYKGSSTTLKPLNLKPHKKGILILPMTQWDANEKIAIDFYDTKGNLVDSYNIKQAGEEPQKPDSDAINADEITLTNEGSELIVHTNICDLYFDKNSGLLTKIEKEGNKMSVSGPFMTYKTKGERLTYSSNTINNYAENWKLKKFNYTLKDDKAIVEIRGNYNNIDTFFILQISTNGNVITKYTFENLPKEYVREIGVRYDIESVFNTLQWERESYWSAYPKNHLSAISGTAQLFTNVSTNYRTAPEKDWELDTKSFYYEGTSNENNESLTNISKSTKENITEYALLKDNKKMVSVYGKGSVSCRLAKKENVLKLYLNNIVDYVDLNWGNYQRNITLDGTYSNEVHLKIN